MKLSELATRELTYPDVGATAAAAPAGYRHAHVSAAIGSGRDRFVAAGAAVLAWGMQHGSGLGVRSSTPTAQVGTEVIVRIGPILAPCRVVYVVDEDYRRGFAYGTLPGHGVSGEELFLVRYDPTDESVYAEVTAFSRPALWWTRLGGPVTPTLQRVIMRRYLQAV